MRVKTIIVCKWKVISKARSEDLQTSLVSIYHHRWDRRCQLKISTHRLNVTLWNENSRCKCLDKSQIIQQWAISLTSWRIRLIFLKEPKDNLCLRAVDRWCYISEEGQLWGRNKVNGVGSRGIKQIFRHVELMFCVKFVVLPDATRNIQQKYKKIYDKVRQEIPECLSKEEVAPNRQHDKLKMHHWICQFGSHLTGTLPRKEKISSEWQDLPFQSEWYTKYVNDKMKWIGGFLVIE